MSFDKIIIQEKENYCVCSALQNIFNKYNKKINQEEIAKNLTPSKKGFYINDINFKNFLNKNGFDYKYYFYNETPFNEPDFLLKEINEKNGFLGYNNHVYLLENFIDPLVFLIDPFNGEIIKKDLTNLLIEMKEREGIFTLIEELHNKL